MAGRFIKATTKKSICFKGARVSTMGLSFTENCPDLRNTRMIAIISELQGYYCQVDFHDPWVAAAEAQS